MSYKFILSKHILRNEQTKELGCNAQIELEMPFLPFIGLTLDVGGFEEHITQVKWVVEDKVLYCRSKDEGPVPGNTYEQTKAIHEDAGWILKKDYEPGKFW